MELGLLSILLVLILVVVTLFSPIGLGGGLLFVPIFHYIGGIDLDASIVLSVSMVFCVAAGSGLAHSEADMVKTPRVKEAIFFAIPLAFIGAIFTNWLVDELIVKILTFLLTSWVLWNTYVRLNSNLEIKDKSDYSSTSYRAVCGTGGLATGMLGIGGGALYVTANRNWGGMTVKKSAGTAFIIAMCVQPFALGSHLLFGSGFNTLIDEIGLVVYSLMLVIVGVVAFNSGKYSIHFLSEVAITRIFVFMISLSMLRYLADIIGIL